MVNNRQCLSCRTSYSYCPNCSGADRFAPSWKAEFCSEPCKDLWLTATKFNMDMLTKHEAKEIISALNLKPIDAYVACVQRDYAKIMADEKKPKRGKRAELNIFDDVADITPVAKLELIDNPVVEIEQQIVTESCEVVKQENE